MDATLVVTVGGEDFPITAPSVQEVREVKRWTGFVSRPAWFTAILQGDADALLAAYVIAKRRKGEACDFNDDVDFPADLDGRFEDESGREVEQVFELRPDGTIRTLEDGTPVAVLDENGDPQWRDVASGTVIPFVKPPTMTGVTPPEPTNSGDTGTGTEATEAS